MADKKISELADGAPAQQTDVLPIVRAGSNLKVAASSVAALTPWATPGTIGSTTPSSGAFTTLSATGNVNLDGGSFVFNEAGADKDFRIEGDTNANLFFSDASADRIGIGTNVPAQRLDVSGNIKFSGALYENVFTITDGAAFEIDPANGTVQTITLGANRTPAATNFAAGQSVTLMILDGTAYTITWSTVNPTWVGGNAPTLDTTKYTVIELWKVGSTIYGALVGYA